MRDTVRAHALVVLTILGSLAVACGPAGPPAGPSPGDAMVAPEHDAGPISRCPAGSTDCSGTCVDTSSDFASCGACGAACESGEVCAAGACTSGGCPGVTTSCGGSCVDLATDERHCGACGAACGATETCEASACVGCGTGTSFAGDVQPIFTRSCLGMACHGGVRPAGNLSLESGRSHAALVGVASSCADGRALVAPGEPGESYVVHKITDDRICTGNRMPLGGSPLSAADVATISDWICGGARND